MSVRMYPTETRRWKEPRPRPNAPLHQKGSVPPQNQTSRTPPSARAYLDRITIAGLHNYLYASDKYEKITWNIGFLLAIVGTMFYLVPAIQQYLQYTIILDIQHQTTPNLRLPNPWVCRWAINLSYIREEFRRVEPTLEQDKRVQLIADRYTRWNLQKPSADSVKGSTVGANTTITVHDLLEYAAYFITLSPNTDDFDQAQRDLHQQPQFMIEILAKAADAPAASKRGIKSFYEEATFDCKSIVRNCSLNGIVFDCCRDNPLGYNLANSKCFKLDIRRELSERTVTHAEVRTLSFETILDASFVKGASEASGVDVSFDNRMFTLFDAWQPLAVGSVSTIAVKATKRRKLTNCIEKHRFYSRPSTHAIINDYFASLSDPETYTVGACGMAQLYEVIYVLCKCIPYIDGMRPQNESDICSPAHLYACVYRGFQNTVPSDGGGGDAEDDAKRDIFHHIKQSMSTECLPLCESWTYDSTVSSMIPSGEAGNVSRYWRNKVTIEFDPEYRVETEVLKMDVRAFVSSMGYSFGLILGISSITIVQIPVWGVVAIVFKMRTRRIEPSSTN